MILDFFKDKLKIIENRALSGWWAAHLSIKYMFLEPSQDEYLEKVSSEIPSQVLRRVELWTWVEFQPSMPSPFTPHNWSPKRRLFSGDLNCHLPERATSLLSIPPIPKPPHIFCTRNYFPADKMRLEVWFPHQRNHFCTDFWVHRLSL